MLDSLFTILKQSNNFEQTQCADEDHVIKFKHIFRQKAKQTFCLEPFDHFWPQIWPCLCLFIPNSQWNSSSLCYLPPVSLLLPLASLRLWSRSIDPRDWSEFLCSSWHGCQLTLYSIAPPLKFALCTVWTLSKALGEKASNWSLSGDCFEAAVSKVKHEHRWPWVKTKERTSTSTSDTRERLLTLKGDFQSLRI